MTDTPAEKLIVCEPGEYRLKRDIEQTCRESGIALEIRDDSHFLCSREAFAAWAKGRRELRMEFFYREMRRRHDVMMEGGTSPKARAGGSTPPCRPHVRRCRRPSGPA